LLAEKRTPSKERLASVRLIQLALGDLMERKRKGTVWEGYSLRREPARSAELAAAIAALRAAFPSGDADLDRKISRTLAALEDDDAGVLSRVVERFQDTWNPVEDIHYLVVAAQLRAPRSADLTKQVAAALLGLDRKLTQRHANRDRSWPLRIAEVYAELARKDPGLHAAMLADPDFGRPDHALFARAPGFDRTKAAQHFLTRARKDPEFTWTPALVDLLGSLPDEHSLPVLRQLWSKAGLDEAILPLLARHPQPGDRDKFLEGLASPQMATIGRCLDALRKLPLQNRDAQVLALIRCLRSLPDGKEEKALRDQLIQRLRSISGQGKLGADKQAWLDWFTKTYRDQAARLGNADGVDVSAWNQRLEKVDWPAGDPERGTVVFLKANCTSCHSGAQALGPDLRGAASRFSREDLFTAIVQPSKDISPRYRTTVVATENGKIYQGLVIYEAVDSLILQTGPAVTVRIPVDQIASRRISPISLMPAGLLDKLTDQEIADLYAYLKKSLGEAPGKK
jgi:putative heme-binding domain-containing protein